MRGSRLIAFWAALLAAAAASVVVGASKGGSLRPGVLQDANASTSGTRSFPPGRNLVTTAEIRQAGAGTPQAVLLKWTQAVQQRDVSTVRRLTSSKAGIAPGTLAAAVRAVGPLFAYPDVINQLVGTTTASLAVDQLSYTPDRAARALSLPTIYVIDRQHGAWRVRSIRVLLKNAADLRRLRRSS
jgi:hypothetical protein